MKKTTQRRVIEISQQVHACLAARKTEALFVELSRVLDPETNVFKSIGPDSCAIQFDFGIQAVIWELDSAQH